MHKKNIKKVHLPRKSSDDTLVIEDHERENRVARLENNFYLLILNEVMVRVTIKF